MVEDRSHQNPATAILSESHRFRIFRYTSCEASVTIANEEGVPLPER